MKFLASSELLNEFHFAVGISYLSMKALAQSLLDSIWAAFFWGPKVLMPSATNTSAIPLAKGSSGPTATKDTSLSLQNFTISWRKK